MEFMNAYKRLEKLCSDMYGTAHGISAYIDDMVNCPRGARIVPDWAHDLKQLKHYRWIRNQIVHEPDCTEEELCTPADTRWLDTFMTGSYAERIRWPCIENEPAHARP